MTDWNIGDVLVMECPAVHLFVAEHAPRTDEGGTIRYASRNAKELRRPTTVDFDNAIRWKVKELARVTAELERLIQLREKWKSQPGGK